jgi:hypothetical protein
MVSRRFMPPDSGSTRLVARAVSWANSTSSVALARAARREIPKYRA